MTTGIFFSEILKTSPGPIIGPKFANFPEVLSYVLEYDNVELFYNEPVDADFLYKFHKSDMIDNLKTRRYGKNAFYSIGGCIDASKMIMNGQVRNGLLINSASGHHAGPNHAWGGTYANCMAPTLQTIRNEFGIQDFVLLDTDRHHGDGDRDMFRDDDSLLHVCFCSVDVDEGTNACIDPGSRSSNENYLRLVREEFIPRAREFEPALIFHFLGHDTNQGDYGDIGLTPEFFPALVEEVKKCAEEVCEGRYLIITGGGARRDIAEIIFHEIVEVLAS